MQLLFWLTIPYFNTCETKQFMGKLRELINRNVSGKKVLLLFILTNTVYAIMLWITIPKTMVYSNGLKLLDMMPLGYSPEYIMKLLETLGEQGRQIYLTIQLPVDMIYPFLFGLGYGLLMGYLLKKLNKLNSLFIYLCYLPIIAGLADYAENFGIMIMLNSFPDLSLISMKVTNVCSIVKSATTTLFFSILLILVFVVGIKSLKKRSHTNGISE